MEQPSKTEIRSELRRRLADLSPEDRNARSRAVSTRVAATPEWAKASVVMLYLATPQEVDTSELALQAWQAGKTVVVPKVSWNQRRILPTEINSLGTEMTTSGQGIREPIAGNPMPVDDIDLVLVPGLGFDRRGNRIGRGMGFYDRFLSQDGFLGLTCGVAFAEQVIDAVPMHEHDVPLGMLVTDRDIVRFTSHMIDR